MAKFGYHPVCFTSVLWKHETNGTIFTLLVGKICAKYTSEVNSENFLNALQKKYFITVDRKAEK